MGRRRSGREEMVAAERGRAGTLDGLDAGLFGELVRQFAAQGLMVRSGLPVDATVIGAAGPAHEEAGWNDAIRPVRARIGAVYRRIKRSDGAGWPGPLARFASPSWSAPSAAPRRSERRPAEATG